MLCGALTGTVLCHSSLWVGEVCLCGVTGPSTGGNRLSGDVGVASCRPVLFLNSLSARS